MSVLSRSDLQRIKESVAPTGSDFNIKAEKRAELKKKSEQRLQHWPNTLEALRKKKESYLKDKEAREEMARREIDLQEAEYQKTQRLESIKRANQLLYEQTDKMKMLRSQQLYADVLQARTEQICEKDIIKLSSLEKEKAYHEDLLVQVREAEELEAQKREAEKRRILEIVKVRESQVREVKNRKQAEKLNDKLLGQLLIKNAHASLEEDMKKEAEQEQQDKLRAVEMVGANQRILEERDMQRLQEVEADKERDRDIKQIEERNYARKALEQRRFEKAQETRQKMIDAAVSELNAVMQKENTRLERQEEEVREKQDKIEAEKEAKKEKDWKKCVESRTTQLQEKIAKLEAAKEIENQQNAATKLQAAAAEKEEKQREAKVKQTVKSIKAKQLHEAIEAQKAKVEVKVAEKQEAAILKEMIVQDEQKFASVVDDELQRYMDSGKPVYTLHKVLAAKPVEFLPAIPVKANNSTKK